MAGLGDEFRAAREARHLSLSDVSEQIHIRSVYLQSIEAEDWSALAAPVYARGFIRTYARFLGLDGERAVAEYGRAAGETPLRPLETKFSQPSRRRRSPSRRSPWLWLTTAIAAVLVGFVAFTAVRLTQDDRRAAPAQVAHAAVPTASASPEPQASASASPVPKAAASAKPSQTAGRTLEVRLTQRSWLAVNVDGTRKLVGVFPAGTRRVFHGTSAGVRAGNAAGVELTVNGKRLGPMGRPGAVAERRISLGEE